MTAALPTHRMIEVFRATVLKGGVSAAADSLKMSQSSASRVLAELQQLVGFQLFVKHGRTVRPTEEAIALMAKVQQSFQGLEDIARFYEQLRKQRMGRLSISVIPAIGHSVMPDAIRHLRSKFDQVLVSLHISSSMEVAMRIRNRQTDIGIATQGCAIGEVESIADVTGDCVCIAPPNGFPADWKHVSLAQLTGRPYVTLTNGTLQQRLEDLLRPAGLELDVMAEASQSLSASELVLKGLGISVVDPFTGGLHRQRGGASLPLQPSLPYKVQVLAMSDVRLSEPARELLRYVEVMRS